MSEYDASAEQNVPTPQDPQVEVGEGPEPASAEDLELSTPGYELDDEPLPATGEEADATRSEWQDEAAEQVKMAPAPVGSTFTKDIGRMFQIASHAADHVASAKGLRKHGLPADVLSTDVRLTMLTGPMVMAGLRLLQFFAPELADDAQLFIEGVQVPVPTDDEKAAINEAAAAYAEEQMAEFMAGLQGAGFEVVSEDELPDLTPEAQLERQGGTSGEQDASLN